MNKDNLRDGRVRNWFYLENDLLDRQDLNIYEKTVYIVIARYVNGENKAFPSYETIAKKGSMAKVQAMRVVKSLTKKGLLKKEVRKTKDNKSYTSNLYTLLNPKPKDKSNINRGGWYLSDTRVVYHRYPNNTNIKNTNLSNVNRASREEVAEHSGGEIKKYPEPKRYRSREKELLAKEISEELVDDHSLGIFRAVVYKILEQKVRIFLSIVKDTYLTGKIKKSRGAMFISLAKAYAVKTILVLILSNPAA